MFLFLFFLFAIDLHFPVPAIIEQTLIPNAELIIPTGIQTNNVNAEIENSTSNC